ncbi:nickel-responsive transcriptional regulator NikR [Telmatospirillum sp. J64-1]|uniref:nickel-responsive transcriptional regulator NikR n=1 Tax=Telmatospirillum sp. J64-1 TaxID=2502183 RepID=UPI00115E0219|nr:nickel-responsive transcriptional regulator NikR [Telmatospirillum sp. J64-1]
MQRITITLDDDLLAEIDQLAAERQYSGRSEAIRDLLRGGLKEAQAATGEGPCIAALVYVYDHAARELSKRLTRTFHSHHHLSLSSLHVHLDESSCMEVSVLRGEASEIRDMATQVISERGVRYGQVVTVRADGAAIHHHGHHHGHSHDEDADGGGEKAKT